MSPPHPIPKKGSRSRIPLQQELTFRTNNVCGWRDETYRKSYLRHASPDILAILETNCCYADEEADWATDWDGQSFWASQYRDPNLQSLSSHRGVVLLLRPSPAFGKGKVIARDPNGRYLAIHVTIHRRPSLIIALHADCGTSQADSFARVSAAITIPPGTLDIHLLTDTNCISSPLDYYSAGTSERNTTTTSRGAAALHTLTQDLGGLCDAFRALHPTTLEFTFIHRLNGQVVSKSRVDRHYLSSHLTSGNAPRLVSCTHLAPTSYPLRHIRGSTTHLTACSDHATVDTTVAYTDTPRPPRTWRLRLHHLKDHSTVTAIRATTSASLTRNASLNSAPKLKAWLADIQAMLKQRHRDKGRPRAQSIRTLHRELTAVENALGEGTKALCHISHISDPIRN